MSKVPNPSFRNNLAPFPKNLKYFRHRRSSEVYEEVRLNPYKTSPFQHISHFDFEGHFLFTSVQNSNFEIFLAVVKRGNRFDLFGRVSDQVEVQINPRLKNPLIFLILSKSHLQTFF